VLVAPPADQAFAFRPEASLGAALHTRDVGSNGDADTGGVLLLTGRTLIFVTGIAFLSANLFVLCFVLATSTVATAANIQQRS
jgi:hypothetical protein